MRHLKFGFPLLGIVIGAIGLTACSDENPWSSSSNEKGSISLTLSTDSGIKTAKPVFRSGDEESATDPNDLRTYIKVPSPEDFSIKLEKISTGETSSWASLIDFKKDISEKKFDTGTYTLTAYHGTKGLQDFEAPYFEASTTFNVLANQEHSVDLTASLMNSMVKINYTDEFKDYMKDYHTQIRTEGIGDPITYGTLETRPLFIEPNNASITLHFTTKGKGITSSVSLGEFPPMAKTLHAITFDISQNASSGDATLEVTFDETLEDENISIDLTEELLTTPAPVITCDGFENGQTLDLLEVEDAVRGVMMTANASDKIASAIMTIESTSYNPSWGKEIDLCKADATQQKAIFDNGIKATGFGFNGTPTDLMATLDLTDFSKYLPEGNHKVSLVVKDSKGKTSQTASVTFDNQEITLELIGNPSFAYGSENGEVTFDFNGLNPSDNIQFAIDNGTPFKALRCDQNATRASEKKTYVFSLPLNKPIKQEVKLNANYKGEKNLGTFTIPVIIPEYSIEAYDAFSNYAYAKVSTKEPSMLSAVTQNIQLKGNGTALTISGRDAQNGIITITGLIPSELNDDKTVKLSSYDITSSITKGKQENEWINWSSNDGTFSTEVELPIPNGNFEGQGETYSLSNLQVGGEYNVAPANYHHTSSFSHVLPAEWATINTLTAWEGSSNKNTWFIVPSSWLENGQAVMKNVGYNHEGTTPSKSGGAFNTKYYCENAPSEDQLVHAAGEIFLGKYSFNGTESRTDGIGFSSRPTAISFDYDYSPIKNDMGYAKIAILDAEGNELGGEIYDIPSGKDSKTISFNNYGKFGKKAAKLIVSFKSSNQKEQVNVPIDIPSGDKLNEKQSLGNKKIATNEYKAVATGSVLKIDNVVAHYGYENTPKGITKKRK